ncbi:MAG TPA: PH domain-containing protein [Candidatus Acidoferrum sp.]|nr:PH domain-containing protein [Candidatus Acidoferrum sp.]
MDYIESNLVPGEKMLYRTRMHWIVLLKPVLFAIVLLFLPGGLLLWWKGREMQWPAVALFALGIIVILYGSVRRNATEMAVTDKRVIIKQGIASRKTLELVLAKVESIVVSETFMGRMLGYGTLVLRGTGGTYETFYEIAHPSDFRNQVQGQIGKPLNP